MSPVRRRATSSGTACHTPRWGDASGGPYAIAARIGRYSASWRWPAALGMTVGLHAVLSFLAFLGDHEHRPVVPKPQQVVTLERPPPEESPPPRARSPTAAAAAEGRPPPRRPRKAGPPPWTQTSPWT